MSEADMPVPGGDDHQDGSDPCRTQEQTQAWLGHDGKNVKKLYAHLYPKDSANGDSLADQMSLARSDRRRMTRDRRRMFVGSRDHAAEMDLFTVDYLGVGRLFPVGAPSLGEATVLQVRKLVLEARELEREARELRRRAACSRRVARKLLRAKPDVETGS